MGRQRHRGPLVLTMRSLDLCLLCLQEQTLTPLETCLAWTLLEERADYSRRSEMTKHDLTLLLRRLTSLDGCSDSSKHHLGENVVIMSATKEMWQLGLWCHVMPAL